MINIAQPIIEKEELEAVQRVLNSGVLAQGPEVLELERAFAQLCDTNYAVAVNSGTAAIHAALYAAGIKANDEVITVPFSFIATINPILMLGARPVLVDIDPTTFNIDVNKIEAAITTKTKAIIPVHLYGQPCDFDKLNLLAKKYKLTLIEDACQAVGAKYKNKYTGNLGHLGCFSLYATKNIMCGEGGIITTNDEVFANKMKQFRQHGMSSTYIYEELGYNYRLTDLQAAIAVEQLKKVHIFNQRRQHNALYLLEGLKNINGLLLPKISDDRTHVFHQLTVRITKDFPVKREKLIEGLKERGIGAGIYYPKPLHAYPHIAKLGYKIGDFPEAEIAASQVLSLPVHPKVTDKDMRKIIASIKEIVDGK